MQTLNALYNSSTDIFCEGTYEMPSSHRVLKLFEGEAIRRYGHFYTIYDTAEEFKRNFNLFCEANSTVWSKLESTLHFDYNPISNYDRTEEATEERDAQRAGRFKNSSSSNSGSNIDTEDTSKVAAYNSADFENKDFRKGSSKINNDNKSDDKSETREDANELVSRKLRVSGNIGVTTTQEMIEAERKVVQFSLLDHICTAFKNEFLVLVY